MTKSIRNDPSKALTETKERKRANVVRVSTDCVEKLVSSVVDAALQDDITKFCALSSVEEQLKLLKCMCGSYLKTTGNQESSRAFVKFTVEIYLCSESKNPIKNAVPRLLTSAPASLHSDIVKTLSECFARMLAGVQDELDSVAPPTTNAIDIVVSNVVIIASNFILGTQAIMMHFKSFLMFLVKSLELYLGALKTERAASVREDLHRKVHNAARASLLLLQCCHNGKGKFVCSPDSGVSQTTTGSLTNVLEEVKPLLQHALCQLLMQEELPLDVRNTCALSLISYCTLLTSKAWQQLVFLAAGQDAPGCFPAILGSTELARLSLCVGLLGSLPVAYLAAPLGCEPAGEAPLRTILESLLVLANKKPSQPILELGTARAIGQVLRIVSSVISVNDVGSRLGSLGLEDDRNSDEYPEEDGTEDAGVAVAVRALFVDTGPRVLPVLWSQVEHSMDAVRHTARGAIQSFVSLAEALEGRGEARPAAALRSSLAELASFRRARYLALAAAAAAGGGRAAFAGALAAAAGATPAALMAAAAGADAAVRPHAAAAFEALQAAEAPPAGAAADARQRWLRRWVRPLLEGLTAAGDAAPPPELEGLVAKAVARFPSGVAALALDAAAAGGGDSEPLAPARLRTLLLCLCAARRHGAFDHAEDQGGGDDDDDVDVDGASGSWKGVVAYALLARCAAHASDEVRLGALALAAEAHRSTEAPSRGELAVARAALAHLAATQAPATRQRAAALLQRLLQRVRASASGAARRRQRRPAALARAAAAFLRRLHAFALASLFPGANFGRRTFALWVLRGMADELGDEAPPQLWDTCNVPALLHALRDPYENNKACALLLLRRFPPHVLHVRDKSFTVLLMGSCLALARSIRPADTVTAAYLLRFLVSFPQEEAVWASIQWMEQQYMMLPAADQVNIGSKTALHCRTIKAFTSLLTRQVNVAKMNIMAAVVEGPMYGVLLCLRLLLEDCDLQSVADDAEWRVTFTQLIDVCYAAVAAVELVVNSASPEGHLPMDAQLFTDLQKNNAEAMNLISPSCASVTAQQVLLCSWRTVKETSLLLGCLAARAPIRETSDSGDKGLIGEEQIFVMGQHFIRLLAEVKHRGAFEQVYVGFTQLCSKLWSLGKKTLQHDSGSNVALHELPANWLNELLKMVTSAGDSYVGTALCVTRRSAGVPFLVQALLATEPPSVTGETSVFPRCMEKLLHLAEGNGSVEACTHALNILRAVFRSSVLVERTAPYLANAVKVAVHGCHVDTWSVRNSATLLFSVLVTRLFGVPSVRDRHRLKRMTGRLFFHQHPTLYDFLLAELTPPLTAFPDSTSSAPLPDSFEPFPALLVLSRLYPSALEGMDSNLQLSRFIPLVSACANCSSERIRALAARALAPLVAPTAWPTLLMSLLETAAACDSGTWNMRRGLLLQVVSLVQTFSTHLARDVALQNRISTWLNSSEWLLVLPQHKTASFPVAEAYIQVLQGLANAILGQCVIGSNVPENGATDVYEEENSVSLKEVERNDGTKINPEIKARWMRVRSIVQNIIGEFESSISSFIPEAGRCLYEMRATQLLLTLTRTLVPLELPTLLSDLVLCHTPEIAHISLSFVLHTFKHIPLRLPFEEEYDDEEELPSDDVVERTLKESSSLSHSIARLLLLPEDQLLPDCRLCCFQLLQHLPLIVPWLIQLLPSSIPSEENDTSDSGKQLRLYRGEITQWLLKEFDTDADRVGPSIIASFSVLFSVPKGFCGNNDLDVSLNANDLLNLCVTIETASSPEYSVELRHAIACLVSSPSVSQYLLHPLKKKVTNPLAICHLWSAVVLLLDDDNPEVRQQAATLVLQLPESGNLPMMEAKAREILVPTFVKTVSRISPLLTAATLTMWILHNFNVTFNKEFDSLEEQVFEQSEANDFEEPALLAKSASSALCLLITENPNLANILLPTEVYSWLITQCWDEFVSQERESMSLQAVARLAEKQLLAMGVEVRPVDCTSFAALKQSLHVPARTRLAALRLQLLQKALGLPMAALKPSSS